MSNISAASLPGRTHANDAAKVIAVCSGKGGVGKTNIATNIAIALAGSRRDVCLLDADVSLANIDVLLGLTPRHNLSHVVEGSVELDNMMLSGPDGVRIVPASSGNFRMTDLPPASQAIIIQSFATLQQQPDVLVVDTAAGISPEVARFVQGAQYPVVVIRDEPASLTDAYALIKVFSEHYGVRRFHIVTNQTSTRYAGKQLFDRLVNVTGRFLDVVVQHLGDVPDDPYLVKAVREQRAVVDAYPVSPSATALLRIAGAIDALPPSRDAKGGIEFFFERLLNIADIPQGKVA